MATRQIVLDIPEQVLLAEKTDEIAFAREIRLLAAVNGRKFPGIFSSLKG